jgi:hypothetical protein
MVKMQITYFCTTGQYKPVSTVLRFLLLMIFIKEKIIGTKGQNLTFARKDIGQMRIWKNLVIPKLRQEYSHQLDGR